MSERKNQEKIKPLPELEKVVTEILVTNGRAVEPFIRTFSATGENISKQGLGTLLGVFEVDEKSEDSAYIVNFLASVAKKEYFSNSHRGAIESFEAALHKINLALTELVKHGNIAWLGKFHGALGVLEKNNLHFSVTGHARIILFRNGTMADISDGLASNESSQHPIKTFVEVSSGRLNACDQVLLSSPELFALFSLTDLERNAQRIGRERFAQFLKTALINELDMSGTLVIDLKEGSAKSLEKKPQKKSEESVNAIISNVFSQSAFSPKSRPSTQTETNEQALAKETPLPEYVDSKTGHIYVQGDTPLTPGGHPFFEHFKLGLLETGHSLRTVAIAQGKWWRKGKKQISLTLLALGQSGRAVTRKMVRAVRRVWKQAALKAAQKRALKQAAVLAASSELGAPTILNQPCIINQTTDTALPTQSIREKVTQTKNSTFATTKEQAFEAEDEIPSFIKEKIAHFYQKELAEESAQLVEEKISAEGSLLEKAPSPWLIVLKQLASTLGTLVLRIPKAFHTLSRKHQKIFLGSLGVLLLFSLAIFYLSGKPKVSKEVTNKQPEPQVKTETVAALPPNNEKNAQIIGNVIPITTTQENIVAPVILANAPYLVTEKSVIEVGNNQSFPLPENSTATHVAVMDDLRLLFIYTENKRLFVFSPINHSFVENTLNLPAGVRVRSIGAYLTYLYVLDDSTAQIYRFPRAEGGFGNGVKWLKDAITIADNTQMTVSDIIYLSAPELPVIDSFFRGHRQSTLESPTAMLSLTTLYTHAGLVNIYALDQTNKRLLAWDPAGQIVAQYFHEKLATATALTVNESENEVFLTTDHDLFSFKLQ